MGHPHPWDTHTPGHTLNRTPISSHPSPLHTGTHPYGLLIHVHTHTHGEPHPRAPTDTHVHGHLHPHAPMVMGPPCPCTPMGTPHTPDTLPTSTLGCSPCRGSACGRSWPCGCPPAWPGCRVLGSGGAQVPRSAGGWCPRSSSPRIAAAG
uniref:Uncharacterized protein n=1 Tax=Anas zonorhyncha TaxID=75864 RepID=A0A8B9UH24_9AVES